ncbi:synaptobrevin-like [Ptychodera flava]|uniref:synaptobrevin-like n=1 Tax=Ptychodera flava TaxID=63121 RepID=UPI00396A9F0F
MSRARSTQTDSSDIQDQDIRYLEGLVDETHGMLRMCVDRFINEGEMLTNLEDRSECVEASAQQFKVKRKSTKKKCKMRCILILLGLVTVFVIVVIIVLATKP